MDVVSSAFANQELRGQDDQLCWALAIIGLFAVRLIALPHRAILIGELVRPGYRDIPTGRLWPHMAQVSFLGPRPFVRESTGAI